MYCGPYLPGQNDVLPWGERKLSGSEEEPTVCICHLEWAQYAYVTWRCQVANTLVFELNSMVELASNHRILPQNQLYRQVKFIYGLLKVRG